MRLNDLDDVAVKEIMSDPTILYDLKKSGCISVSDFINIKIELGSIGELKSIGNEFGSKTVFGIINGEIKLSDIKPTKKVKFLQHILNSNSKNFLAFLSDYMKTQNLESGHGATMFNVPSSGSDDGELWWSKFVKDYKSLGDTDKGIINSVINEYLLVNSKIEKYGNVGKYPDIKSELESSLKSHGVDIDLLNKSGFSDDHKRALESVNKFLNFKIMREKKKSERKNEYEKFKSKLDELNSIRNDKTKKERINELKKEKSRVLNSAKMELEPQQIKKLMSVVHDLEMHGIDYLNLHEYSYNNYHDIPKKDFGVVGSKHTGEYSGIDNLDKLFNHDYGNDTNVYGYTAKININKLSFWWSYV